MNVVVVTNGASRPGDGSHLSGIVFDGRFRIEEWIAEGGFSYVYKAVQVALDRRVALKVLKLPRFDDEAGRTEFRERFAAEARTIARIRHPHIVDVYDFSVSTLGSGELAPWMALEWLEGETLAGLLKRRRDAGEKGMLPAEALDLLRPAVEALAHAHGQGVVHRDVKPANIMVARTPNGPSLRVLDFGIAKMMSDDKGPSTGDTRTESTPAFSPSYAAPEQVTFSRTGPWTDVHALGLILSELMTGEAPFRTNDPDAHTFERVMAAARPTPASRGRDVRAFEPVLAKALALAPRDRWRNAGELLAALDEAKAGRVVGVEATASRAPTREPRSRRARVWAFALGAALIAAGVLRLAWRRDGAFRPADDSLSATASGPIPAPVLATPPVVAPASAAAVAPAIPPPPAKPPAKHPLAKRRAPEPFAAPLAKPAASAPRGDQDLFDDPK
jgi:serine/threonine-protein kinase